MDGKVNNADARNNSILLWALILLTCSATAYLLGILSGWKIIKPTITPTNATKNSYRLPFDPKSVRGIRDLSVLYLFLGRIDAVTPGTQGSSQSYTIKLQVGAKQEEAIEFFVPATATSVELIGTKGTEKNYPLSSLKKGDGVYVNYFQNLTSLSKGTVTKIILYSKK